jgi:hypothetical protein
MNKKGALELSVNMIVIIVIAFVVLGLALVLTKMIFQKTTEQIPDVFNIVDIEIKPTSEYPITGISENLELNRKEEKELKLGFYNKGEETAVNAGFVIKQCIKGSNEKVGAEISPTIISIFTDVPAGEPKGYKVILKDNGLPLGNYICELAVICEKDCPPDLESPYYETEQFSLKIN